MLVSTSIDGSVWSVRKARIHEPRISESKFMEKVPVHLGILAPKIKNPFESNTMKC